MGLLDSVIGALGQGGGGSSGGAADLLGAVAGMLQHNAPGGGLAGLVAAFEQGGLGDVIGSWVGHGQNLPVSAAQLQSVLGGDTVARIAEQLGLSHADTAGQLSQLLPQVIDKLTPTGQLPTAGVTGSLGNLSDLLGSP